MESNKSYQIILEEIPRIAAALKLFWGTEEFDMFVNNLLRDSRDGARQGFPKHIAQALFRLAEDHAILFGKLK